MSPRFASAACAVEALPNELTTLEPEAMIERIKTLEDALGEIEDVGEIRTPLSRARRELGKDDADADAIAMNVAEAVEAYRVQIEWRRQGAETVLPQLTEFEQAIRTNIGLRQLDRLPREQALAIASCKSVHRDISLSF